MIGVKGEICLESILVYLEVWEGLLLLLLQLLISISLELLRLITTLEYPLNLITLWCSGCQPVALPPLLCHSATPLNLLLLLGC